MRLAASPQPHVRVGIIVPKLKQSAVARNRLKRRLRELARLNLLDVAKSSDVILLATKEAFRRSFDELRDEVLSAKDIISGAA